MCTKVSYRGAAARQLLLPLLALPYMATTESEGPSVGGPSSGTLCNPSLAGAFAAAA